MAFSYLSLSLSEGWPFLPAWSRGRQADRKSIPGGFTVRPACCCTQAGRQARQARLGRLNTVIISELCQPCPAYLLPARTSQPVIEHQHPRPTSLSPLNFSFQAKSKPGFPSKCFQILTSMLTLQADEAEEGDPGDQGAERAGEAGSGGKGSGCTGRANIKISNIIFWQILTVQI